MSAVPEIPRDCFEAPTGAIAPGDICAAVPFPSVEPDGQLFQSDELASGFGLEARLSYAAVLRVFEGYAVVAPVTTADVVTDHGSFSALVDSGKDAESWVTLPPLPGEWDADAVVLLFMPHTVHADVLGFRQIASMSPAGSDALARRAARAFGA